MENTLESKPTKNKYSKKIKNNKKYRPEIVIIKKMTKKNLNSIMEITKKIYNE